MGNTEFCVLGPLEVADAGGAVALGSGRQAALLASLLLRANEIVSSEGLIEALWGTSPPASAANALQVQVHALRKRLGPERIRTEGAGYVLAVEPGELDLERFERLVERGRCELSGGDPAAATTTLTDALSLWRGPPLADVAYEAFAQEAISRIEELGLTAVETRIEAGLALARHAELVPELEALVAEHPLRERLHGQLMLALYRSGRQTDALAAFRRARSISLADIGTEPGAELRELQQAILRHDAALRIEPPELRERRHLPAAQTPLVGRRRELAETDALLRGGVRLLTLTGPGGTGKTRLALQAAHDLADVFRDGVFFVDLAPLREPVLVPSAIAQAVGVEELLGPELRSRRVLLLVDNFEAVDEAAPLLGELLAVAPDLALLVTSRTPLRLSAEHEYRVHPLPLADAARLFTDRARAVAPGFRRAGEEAEEVEQICRRLDCLPLAIELAAAQTRRYSPAEMLALLPRLELAEGGARDLPERQRTLRATIDWSHELLSSDEQQLFARLAVFAGGCTPESAAAVCGARRSALASLVAAALLYEHLGSDRKLRFSMLETVREYALERLEASGAADSVRADHAIHFTAYAEAAEDDTPALEAEHDNLRAAIHWSRGAGTRQFELRLVAALAVFWSTGGHLPEGRERVDAALRNGESGPAPLRAKVLGGAGWLAFRNGDYERAETLVAESLAAYRVLGDEPAVALALNRLGAAVSGTGDIARATALQEESAAAYRALGDRRGLGVALSNLGYRRVIAGDLERARLLLEEALEVLRNAGERGSLPLPLVNLGLTAFLQGLHDEALAHYREGLELAAELGSVVLVIACMDGLASALAATGDAEHAATIVGAVEAAEADTGVSLEPYERGVHERTVVALTQTLDGNAFDLAYETGRQLARDEAVVFALGRVQPAALTN